MSEPDSFIRAVSPILLVALALVAAAFLFLAAAATSGAIDQCPLGNDCGDAVFGASVGYIVGLTSLGLLVKLIITLRRPSSDGQE